MQTRLIKNNKTELLKQSNSALGQMAEKNSFN